VTAHKVYGVKIFDLCKMVQDSIRTRRYPFQDSNQEDMATIVEIINRSAHEDLKGSDIRIETRIRDLYVLNNYTPNMQHLPGIIEMDVLDSFKMLCRRLERIEKADRDNESNAGLYRQINHKIE
jgi:hypothetical protein